MAFKKKCILTCALYLLFFSAYIAASTATVDFPGNVELIYYDDEEITPYHPKPLKKIRVADKILYVLPGVIVPTVHGALFVEHTEIYSGEDVLDLGTGCGIQGVFAADKARRVVSTDISLLAVENARLNAKFHRIENIMEARQGDLFGPIKKDEKFDVVLFNMDPPYSKETQGLWDVHERFFKNVGDFLKPNGRIYYESASINYIARVRSMVLKNNLRIMKINMVTAVKQNMEPYVLLIQRVEPIK